MKLPGWFEIDTPVGNYNPDWAIIKHDDQTLYLVRETKSTKDFLKLRTTEADKVRCGQKHFKTLADITKERVRRVIERINREDAKIAKDENEQLFSLRSTRLGSETLGFQAYNLRGSRARQAWATSGIVKFQTV